jgi:hypothetical protein
MKRALKCSKMQILKLKEALNYEIFAKLKYRRKARMICEIEVQIEQRMYDYLEQKFKLSKRYKQNEHLIKSLDLIEERLVCDTAKIIIDTSFCMAKLYQKKKIVLSDHILNGPLYLKLKFKKEEIVISTE